MAVQEQLPLRVKPQFLDMVWYSVSLFREGMIATLGGRNIWWKPVSGGRQTWCRVSCLTMPIIHNDDAAPCISRTGTMVWSVAQYASPPHPHPPSRPHVHLLTSSDFYEQPSTVHLTFETSSHRLDLSPLHSAWYDLIFNFLCLNFLNLNCFNKSCSKICWKDIE